MNEPHVCSLDIKKRDVIGTTPCGGPLLSCLRPVLDLLARYPATYVVMIRAIAYSILILAKSYENVSDDARLAEANGKPKNFNPCNSALGWPLNAFFQ
jgi:hypothetical protein